jgi:hypothetical protein
MYLLDFTVSWDLPHRKRELRLEQAAVKKFIETRDIASLQAPELNGVFPFSAAYDAGLAKDLQDPEVIAFLPPEMTPSNPEQKRRIHRLSQIRVFLLRAADILGWATMSAFALAISTNLLYPKGFQEKQTAPGGGRF